MAEVTIIASAFDGFEKLVSGIATPVSISILAVIARIAKLGWKSWANFFSCLSVSCFMGIITYWGLDYCDFSETIDAAIIGLSSYLGGTLLDIIVDRIRDFFYSTPVPPISLKKK